MIWREEAVKLHFRCIIKLGEAGLWQLQAGEGRLGCCSSSSAGWYGFGEASKNSTTTGWEGRRGHSPVPSSLGLAVPISSVKAFVKETQTLWYS